MKKIFSIIMVALFACGTANAQNKNAAMASSKKITENIAQTKEFSILNDGLVSTGIAAKLSGKGPFTLFAVTNDGFDKTLHGTSGKLQHPDKRELFSKIINYHIVQGRLTAQDLKDKIAKGKGETSITALNGETLKVSLVNGKIVIKDASGNSATIVNADVAQANGLVHVVDALLLPIAQ